MIEATTPPDTSASSAIEHVPDQTIDTMVQATYSEARIALLGCLGRDRSFVELRDDMKTACGYAPNSYFTDTLRDLVVRMPAGTVTYEDTNDENVVSRTKLGTKAAAAGGLLLEQVSLASRDLSLVHLYGNLGNRAMDREGQQLSGHWRVFKMLDTLLTFPVTLKDMADIYSQYSTVIGLTGIKNIIKRLASSELVTEGGRKGKSTVWQLTDRGFEVAAPAVACIEAVATDEGGGIECQGLEALENQVVLEGSRRTVLPLLIKRAKLAGNREAKRLLRLNEQLELLARQNGGTLDLTTPEIATKLGESITQVQLRRVKESVPGSVIRQVWPRAGGHDGNRWVIEATSPSRYYA